MAIKLKNDDTAKQMAEAMQNPEDTDALAAAWKALTDDIASQVREDYADEVTSRDAATLNARGYRVLTSQENRFYEKLADALKDPKVTNQSFIDILGSDDVDELMPDTIINDVLKDIQTMRPLLSKVSMTYVNFATKWIVDDASQPKGAWGKIDAGIVTEVEGALLVIDVTQNKYSAFAVIPLDILDMGPDYLDAYVRALLAEAMSYGIEDAIVNGTGVDMPIGITRDPDGTYDKTTGYPKLDLVKVTSFDPVEYGALCARLAVNSKGKPRAFGQVQLICNMVDYLTKIMPATTVRGSDGRYVNDIFPFPTEAIPSTAMAQGEAVLCLLSEYKYLVGGRRNGIIEYDDSFKFIDDARTFKVLTHGAGRLYDKTCAVRLDVSELEPANVTVKVVKDADASETKPTA